MTIQLTTKKKKILTNNQNEAYVKPFFSCNLDYGDDIFCNTKYLLLEMPQSRNNYLK
jgi:hypothetical protein